MQEFITRIVSATFLAIVAVGLVLSTPTFAFKILISVLAAFGTWEVSNLFKKKYPNINDTDISIVSFFITIFFLFFNIYLSLLLIFLYAFYIATKIGKLNYIGIISFILIYGTVFIGSIGKLFAINKELVLVLFATVWAGDMFAYIFGKTIGFHKLAPKLSPNKTIEGAIGGAIGSIIVGGFVALYLNHNEAIIPIVISSFVMQLGDLLESFIKRQVNVKDSSNLIPGHGGILDRIDALIFASMVFLTFYIHLANAIY